MSLVYCNGDRCITCLNFLWNPELLMLTSPASSSTDTLLSSVVAEVIWTAVTDGTGTLRYTAGDDAKEYIANRSAMDDQTFIGGLKASFGLA